MILYWQIASTIFAKVPFNITFNAVAYRWFVRDKGYYPTGGMQAIPNEAVRTLKQNGSEVLLNTEVTEILLTNGRAAGVRTSTGDQYFANAIISNAAPHFTYSLLPDDCKHKTRMQKKIKNKQICQSCCLLFMSVDDIDTLNGSNYIYIGTSESCTRHTENFTPENCPIILQVAEKKEGDTQYAITALAPIPYEYMDNWRTGGTEIRGDKYYELKENAKQILLQRIYKKLGTEFASKVTYAELGTPLTFKRYTNNTNGSFMGWALNQGNYGNFMKQKTDVPNLTFVGQWSFPGFGIAGVTAGGYYLAKDLLETEGISLEKDFADFFNESKI